MPWDPIKLSLSLKKMSNLLLLDGVSYKHQLDLLVDGVVHFICILADFPSSSFFSYWERVLNSQTTIFNLSVSLFSSASFWFMYLEALLFGAYPFRIFMSSWWIGPFIIMCYSSLFLIIFLTVKNTLSDINIATWTFFWLVICIVYLPSSIWKKLVEKF